MRFLSLLLALPALSVWAEEPPGFSTQEVSVEDNIRAMDRDHDGMVSVTEVRAYLEAKHGKGYRREVLDEMEAKAGAKSCASPFSKSFY